jgi:hypothetical protein
MKENPEHNRPMALVRFDGALIQGLNIVAQISEDDLTSPYLVEIPLALEQQWTFARGMLAAAEGAILAWMRDNDVKPELVAKLMKSYEAKR